MGSPQSVDAAATTSAPTGIEPVATGPARNLVSWLAPDMALLFAITTLLMLFFKLGGSTGLFGDSDTGWHIRIGEHIIATHALPHTDPFSFSKPGAPWVAWEWGADVLMGATHRICGLAGVALLYGLAIGAAVWMWFRLNRAAGGNLLITGPFIFRPAASHDIHWLARPHIFSWLFLLGTVWLCERCQNKCGGAIWRLPLPRRALGPTSTPVSFRSVDSFGLRDGRIRETYDLGIAKPGANQQKRPERKRP